MLFDRPASACSQHVTVHLKCVLMGIQADASAASAWLQRQGAATPYAQLSQPSSLTPVIRRARAAHAEVHRPPLLIFTAIPNFLYLPCGHFAGPCQSCNASIECLQQSRLHSSCVRCRVSIMHSSWRPCCCQIQIFQFENSTDARYLLTWDV